MSSRTGAGSVSRRLSERARAAANADGAPSSPDADLFGRLRQMVDHITQAVGAASQQTAGATPSGRVVFGYNVSMGLDGLRMEPFGDVQPPDAGQSGPRRDERAAPPAPASRAPIVDVFEEGSTVRVIAELPGVSESDISCRMSGLELQIETTGAHRYAKIVRLPWLADAASLSQTCRNGILEVRLTREAIL